MGSFTKYPYPYHGRHQVLQCPPPSSCAFRNSKMLHPPSLLNSRLVYPPGNSKEVISIDLTDISFMLYHLFFKHQPGNGEIYPNGAKLMLQGVSESATFKTTIFSLLTPPPPPSLKI